ncbi:MAG: hypothetical protein ACRC46_12300 [Thermoguttaceae bacterium]
MNTFDTFDPAFLDGIPAPVWLVLFLKVLGFTLHMIPMGIWFVGLPVAICCSLTSCERAQRFAGRIFQQLPIFVALGINFGIVPLLFLQTMMPKAFYTATILIAWQWLAVVPLLLVAYYAIYLAAFSVRDGRRWSSRLAGVVASVSLCGIGIVMTCGLVLMVSPNLWDSLWEKTNVAGAVTGLAHSVVFVPDVWVRLLAMASLGLLTTGIWAIVDSHLLLPPTDANLDYRRWTRLLATLLVTLSVVGLTCVEWFVKSGVIGDAIKTAYPLFGYVLSIVILIWLYLLIQLKAKSLTTSGIVLLLFGYVMTIAHFAIYRQMGQMAALRGHSGLLITTENVEWTPIIAFLLLFVSGVACVVWMVRQIALSGIDKA